MQVRKDAETKQDRPQRSLSYEAPAIIYEGKISTRAGTPTTVANPDVGGGGGGAADPADIFGGKK